MTVEILPDRRELVERTLRKLLCTRANAARHLDVLDARIESLYFDLCRDADDEPQDVETYDGTLGVDKAFLKKYSPPVGQLRWRDDAGDPYTGVNDAPGTIAGQK